jgi:hypothetical protein
MRYVFNIPFARVGLNPGCLINEVVPPVDAANSFQKSNITVCFQRSIFVALSYRN